MPLLSGKTAIITGASRGIGKSIALKFASEGANIVLTATNEELLKANVKEIESEGWKAAFIVCDVSNTDSVAAVVKFAIETFGTVDILVNNAGITRDKLLMAMKEDDWDTVLNVNLKGAFNGTKAVSRTMLKARTGCIINVTSVVGISGNAGQANYAASKAGMIGLTKSSAKEFASRGIRVNAIAPGFIETDMTSVLNEEAVNALLGNVPLARPGSGDEVAECAVFLASDMASYITGQVINVDGGMLM